MSLELLIFLVCLTVLIKLGMVFFGEAFRAYHNDVQDVPQKRKRLLDNPEDGEWVDMIIEDAPHIHQDQRR